MKKPLVLKILNLIFLYMFSYNLGTAEKIVGLTSLISLRSLSSEVQKNISALINKGKNIPATLSYECDKGRKDINLSLLIFKSLNISTAASKL